MFMNIIYKKIYKKNNNGSAFLYILLILALLSSIILTFISSTINYINFTNNYKNKSKAYYIAKSGISLSTYFVSQYGSNPVSYQELLNKIAPYEGGYPILGGKIKMFVINNDSKFNINQLIFADNQINYPEYSEVQRLFYAIGIPSNILENIITFAQKYQLSYNQLELEFTKLNGNSKAKEYLINVNPNSNIPALNTEYKNTFLTIRDLMLVPGMRYKYYFLLKQFLTVNSSGLIDINTAPYEVIESLNPLISSSAAKELVNYRINNPLTSVSALTSVPGFNSSILSSIVNSIEISSTFYLIKSVGEYSSARVTIESLYNINGGSVQKIYEIIS
ncbi:MAG: helix-hairpin-helix domain-containing protein [bacterium]